MLIYGVDFTCAPSRIKAITCAHCLLSGQRLQLVAILRFEKLTAFESFLEQKGSWLAAIDAPFGQARQLILDWQLPLDWSAYVRALGSLSRQDFVSLMNDYRRSRPQGHKELKRQVDIDAKALSPMKVYGVPVGRMFHSLAPRLAATILNLPVLRPTAETRSVIEAYPALVVRKLKPNMPYKNGNEQDPVRQRNRASIVASLADIATQYGLRLELTKAQSKTLLDDASGDSLDALLAAIQAGWAQQQTNYGMPENTDVLEGYIADPELYQRYLTAVPQ